MSITEKGRRILKHVLNECLNYEWQVTDFFFFIRATFRKIQTDCDTWPSLHLIFHYPPPRKCIRILGSYSGPSECLSPNKDLLIHAYMDT